MQPDGHPQSPDTVVVNVGGYRKRLAIGGTVAGLLLGVVPTIGLVAALLGGDGGSDTPLAVAIPLYGFGLAFLVLGVFSAWKWSTLGKSLLFIEPAGIRLSTPKEAFAVPWPELAGVGIAWSVARAGATQTVNRTVTCHLDLLPADAQFRRRHPEMEPFWQRRGLDGGYRLLIGSGKLIPRLEAGLTRFGPGLFRGVQRIR